MAHDLIALAYPPEGFCRVLAEHGRITFNDLALALQGGRYHAA